MGADANQRSSGTEDVGARQIQTALQSALEAVK